MAAEAENLNEDPHQANSASQNVEPVAVSRAQLTVGMILLVGFLVSLAVAWESRRAFELQMNSQYRVIEDLLQERINSQFRLSRVLVMASLNAQQKFSKEDLAQTRGREIDRDVHAELIGGFFVGTQALSNDAGALADLPTWNRTNGGFPSSRVSELVESASFARMVEADFVDAVPVVMPLLESEQEQFGLPNGVLVAFGGSRLLVEPENPGIVVMVFKGADLLNKMLSGMKLEYVYVDLAFPNAEGEPWQISNRPESEVAGLDTGQQRQGWLAVKPGQQEARVFENWGFTVSGIPGYESAQVIRAAIIFSIGMALTLLTATVVWMQSQRTQRIHELIERRTRALKQAQEDLAGQNTLLRSLNVDLQVAREEAEVASKSKSEFLATISHELRTPLNAILGFSQILWDQDLGDLGDERYVDYARNINTSGTHLLSLINDILDLAKLEAGHLTIDRHSVSPYQLVDKVELFLGAEASAKGIELKCTIHEDLPSSVIGDMLRLRQILINLTANAVKFTEEGYVHVRLREEPLDNGSPGWIMSVEDTGAGIPEDKLDTLFERFTQVDSALSRHHSGVGLGLAICKQLTLEMGGSIHVESVLDEGTHIWVHLPLEDDMDAADDQDDMI